MTKEEKAGLLETLKASQGTFDRLIAKFACFDANLPIDSELASLQAVLRQVKELYK